MFADPHLWISLLTLIAWLLSLLAMGRGSRALAWLREVEPVSAADAPAVSVVIAARDEAPQVEAALRSVLAQHYPRLEVIVVDDRSTDATGTILDRMKAQHPRLRVLHVERLPPQWLGKNHALQRGAELAGGQWLLFADADVVLHPEAIGRGVGHAIRARLHHLAVAPELDMPGAALRSFGAVFAVLFAQFTRPWRVGDPNSPSHVGVGAFNLVRRDAYLAVGGHRPIAMRPDDDLKLGKLLKLHGFRQELAVGRGLVSVEWYSSLGAVVRGLEKNAFAGLEYSLVRVAAAIVLLLLLYVWPFVAPLATVGAARWLYLGTVAAIWTTYAGATRSAGGSPWLGFAVPLLVLLFIFALARSAWVALRDGGVRWRDTFYPLHELRANRV